MICLELFLGFLEVGCFSFGGAYAAIPLIREIVLAHGWLEDEMLTGMIAVSESTPGPIMVNLATYVGKSQAGLPGAIAATLAVVLPSFIVILLVTRLLSRVVSHPWVQAVLRGIKPAMVGIILATGCRMILGNFLDGALSMPDVRAMAVTAVLAGIYFGSRRFMARGLSPVGLILLAAVLGAFVYGG